MEDSFDGYESIDSASVALEWRVLSRYLCVEARFLRLVLTGP
jgi:hypothetical protein